MVRLERSLSIPLVACLVLCFALGAFYFLPLKVNGATTVPLSVESICTIMRVAVRVLMLFVSYCQGILMRQSMAHLIYVCKSYNGSKYY